MKTKTILITPATILITTALIFHSCNKGEQQPNQPPACKISAPANGQEIKKGETVTIAVDADDSDGTISEVRFFIDNIGVGSSTSFPYNYEWNTGNEETGNHTLKATAIDNNGEKTSDDISVTLISAGTNLELVNVNGGTFQMGSTAGYIEEQPQHTVTLSSFKISKYEITNKQFCEFLNDIGCDSNGSYDDPEYGLIEYIDMDDDDVQIEHTGGQFVPKSEKTYLPVVKVTWYGANAFAKWAGGRLPTEAEWEFAARGGTNSNQYAFSGSNHPGDVAWYEDNSEGHTHQVGAKSPNELGIYDMSGNVWEWCHDWFDANYYSISPENNPQGPETGTGRVGRGGGWSSPADYCRTAYRGVAPPDDSENGLGFRVVIP